MNNTVAIITRTKNRPLLLRRAIASVASQSYKNYIHIIVNDGAPLEHQILTRGTIIIPIDSGGRMEYASNAGLEIALKKADYAIIHDDDDSWSPDFLRIMIRELKMYESMSSSIKGILCRANRVYERIEGNIILTERLEPHAFKLPEIGLLIPDIILDDNNNFAPIQFLYNLDIFSTGMEFYNPIFRVYGDWDFNLRFLQQYDIALIPQYLAFYHLRPNNFGGSTSNSINTSERSLQREVYRQLVLNNYIRSSREKILSR